MITKRIHAAQYRVGGMTAGPRTLRRIEGRQHWLLKIWLQLADGGEIDQQITVDQPCFVSDLMALYEKAIHEVCEGTPVVTAGGFDAYALPRRR